MPRRPNVETLFVDCENTLYVAKPRTELHGAASWEPNWDVVAAMERWRRANRGSIVVWSAAGPTDADMWRRRVVPHMVGVEASSKDLRRPGVSDVLIDDMKPTTAGTSYLPAQSFMIAPETPGEPSSEPATTA